MDGVHHWRYSEYHMEEKQVGERQQNNPNAIMFREDARFRNQRAVSEAAERFPRWVKRKKWDLLWHMACDMIHDLNELMFAQLQSVHLDEEHPSSISTDAEL